ncbi:excinuclease ABC subunit UvrA [Catenulispora pinisilvae]|uniref:excinuclease ABC subunit UvrA n=1 Tax=Catenulispora pinisilvae TaxID=2705253 RepID=UPI001E61683D|nr:excinuclease ABC subunit UvrA [Catenulispora pinisilvae]
MVDKGAKQRGAGSATATDPMIRVHDATEHNLRHVDVAVPRDQIVAFTGVSGSGKSSLAFATIYAEAQRRYLESVAPYARRLIEQAGAPRVGGISGLPPAVALRQQYAAGSARSSVGTVSRVSNVLRMLYSRAGTYPAGAEPVDSDWFSPNTAVGACPTCHGLGRRYTVDEGRLVGDPELSIRQGAIAAWPGAWQGKNYRDILGELGIDIDAPFRALPAERRHWLLTTEEQPVVTVHPVREAHRITRPYQGTYMSPRSWVLHTYATTKSASLRTKAASFLTEEPCPTCEGRRLNPFALSVTIAGVDIAEATALPLAELAGLLERARVHPDTAALSPERRQAAEALIGNLEEHLRTLTELGLGYLGTDRATSTLSAGEFQRLHLATQLGSGLFGVLYVLDEPSAGLHPADTELLLTALRRLRAAGNSVFVVEHNPRVISDAEWLVDLGPGAGTHGGRVLHSGPTADLMDVPESATARYLFGDAPSIRPTAVREPSSWLTLFDVTRHNLDRLTVRFPLGTLTAVTGVSGSGKSTLVGQVLAATVRDHLGTPADAEDRGSREDREASDEEAALDDDRIIAIPKADGLSAIQRLVQVDQKPIGRTPRSNLATYTGLFDTVRKLFAAQPLAKERGYTASRFSFNLPNGRCPNCQGEGVVSVELLFLPTESAPCPVCHGARYNPETLQVLVDGKSVADVLALSVEDALSFLEHLPAAHRILSLLDDIGLGYLTLGQSATTLSGGEAQRIKLVSELHRARRGHTLYLLDEPTSGLHPADADLLLARLRELVDQRNTVVMVEHDMRVAAAADWLLDLGPGAGNAGGRIVAEGTPAEVSGGGSGRTARFLAEHTS